MRKSLLAVFAVFVIIAMTIPSASCAEDITDGVNDDVWHFKGQITHDNDLKTSPYKVTIVISQNDTVISEKYEAHLSEHGEFDVSIKSDVTITSGTTYNIKITETGYTVVNKPTEMIKQTDGSYNITLTDNHINAGTKTVTLTLNETYISMIKSVSSLKGTVISSSGDKTPLNGVKITLTNPDPEAKDQPIVTFTDGKGEYSFNDIRVGDYKLVAESKGFQQYVCSELVSVELGQTNIKDIEMTPSEDIDVSHWMTIIGGTLSILILAAVIGHIIKSRRKRA